VSTGFVSLVGAGPGAVDLLTLRGARALAAADVVFYDALAGAELLELAPRARHYFVGKRAGRPSMKQATIEALLIRAARRGQRVVRLKGGDPFVFGRGGEEALALARAGVAFEVVPGISSPVAGPGAAGVPVTHRGVASSMLLVTGEPDDAWQTPLRALAPGGKTTIVMLMGLAKRAALRTLLLERGWSPATPCAIVLAATTPRQHRVLTTLAALPDEALPPGEPGVIVIGDVVSVAAQLDRLVLPEDRHDVA
jgi:uroporphyrin-III C-methyltransferase